jgi:hypothetical protein
MAAGGAAVIAVARGEVPGRERREAWLGMLRRYFLFAAVANLVWEFTHLPLYTSDGSA